MRSNPPWLFGILSIPYGLYNGISATLMPYLLRKHNVGVDRIAEIVAISTIPFVWAFCWSPLVDLGPRRRSWILAAAASAAACGWLAVLASSGSLALLTFLLFAGSVLVSLLSTACGAVLTTLPPTVRGRASGWYQAGNLGGGAMGAGATIWLAGFSSLPVLGAVSAVAVFVPALAAVRISEAPLARLNARELFSSLARDVRRVIWSRRTLVGLVFFLSPVGSAAVMNLISGIGPDYHASDAEVAWIAGAAGGLVSAAGGLAGGFASDRINRMTAYALAGFFGAGFAAWMALGPATAFTYGAGYIGYSLAAGFAYAAFTALVLDVLGGGHRAAGTGYSVLVASGNAPIAYMTWLDGVGYHRAGVRGLMGVDALANGVGGMVLLLFAQWAIRRRWMD